MKSFTRICGVILIVLGIISLSYSGFTYTTQEKLAQIGDVKITAAEEKHVPFSPVAGGLFLIVGIGLILLDRFRNN